MFKSWIALAFLPVLAACAGTMPGPQMAQQCKMVDQDNTDSHIKVKNECASPAQGNAVDPQHQVQTEPAPQ